MLILSLSGNTAEKVMMRFDVMPCTLPSKCILLALLKATPCLLQPTDINRNYLWAALMFVFPMFGAVAYVHSSRLSIIVQIQLRAELTAAVYRKALRLSSRYACQVPHHILLFADCYLLPHCCNCLMQLQCALLYVTIG